MAMKKPAEKARGRQSRLKGVKASGDRTPQLGPGEYILEITGTEVSRDRSEYYKAHATVVEVIDDQRDSGDPGEGDECLAMLQCIAGNSAKPGYARIKSFAMALAGFEDEAEFDEADPDGLFGEFVLNDGSDGKDEDGDDYEPIEGRRVRVRVRKGKRTKDDDDYYRENQWSPAPAKAAE